MRVCSDWGWFGTRSEEQFRKTCLPNGHFEITQGQEIWPTLDGLPVST